MPEVVLVCGPPCAGKSTWANTQAGPDDRVYDSDVMGRDAFDSAVEELKSHRPAGTTFVIRCLPGEGARSGYALAIGADRTVFLRPSDAVLLQRAASRRDGMSVQAVRAWLAADVLPSAPPGRNPDVPMPKWLALT